MHRHLRNATISKATRHIISSSSSVAAAAAAVKTMTIPTSKQVLPGTTVAIILKADQRTGRQVTGTVADILTRIGNDHPHGIKVRLIDGRVGRVQRMISDSGSATSAVNDNGKDAVRGQSATLSSSSRQYGGVQAESKYQDERYDGHSYVDRPAESLDLAAYIKPARQQAKKKQNRGQRGDMQSVHESGGKQVTTPTSAMVMTQQQQQQQQQQQEKGDQKMSRCPVCEQFEGDEIAVAHHVEQHFGQESG